MILHAFRARDLRQGAPQELEAYLTGQIETSQWIQQVAVQLSLDPAEVRYLASDIHHTHICINCDLLHCALQDIAEQGRHKRARLDDGTAGDEEPAALEPQAGSERDGLAQIRSCERELRNRNSMLVAPGRSFRKASTWHLQQICADVKSLSAEGSHWQTHKLN